MARKHDNFNRTQEWTDELLIIPNQWGFINSLNIFKYKGSTQHSFLFDETTRNQVLLLDTPRGERSTYGTKGTSKTHSVPIPHFTYDDAVLPEDLQGVRMEGTEADNLTLAAARAEVLERARRNWSITQEYARMQALKGDVYSPNGTVSINWYTEFGVTQKVVDFLIDNPAGSTDVRAKVEEVISHMQDNLFTGEMLGRTIVVCSPEFFTKLINHDAISDAYMHYSAMNNQGGLEPLRDRLTYNKDARMRVFEYQGLTFVEYRGSFVDAAGATKKLVDADEAYAFPLDVPDMYRTVYSPAHRLSKTNTVGLEQYIFEKLVDDKRWEYESESSFLNFVRRPGAVVKLTTTA